MQREVQAVGRVYQPMSRALEIAVRGLRVRLGRSIVTLSSVVLAVTFLSYTGTINVINKALVLAWQETSDQGLKLVLEKFSVNVKATLEGDPRDTWLIVLSLLTCGVGIANAMLMSVTERFREIGTMKCLGALSSFVVKLFLIESLILGLVGAALGSIAGGLFSLLAYSYTFGFTKVFAAVDFATLGLYAVLGVAAGVVLAIVAAIYPARVAARMIPATALASHV